MTKLNKLKLIGLIAVSSSVNAINWHEVVSPFHVDGSYNFYNNDMGSLFIGGDFSYFHNNGLELGLRSNGILTVIPNLLYKDIFYGIGAIRFGTAITYKNFKDNIFKKINIDILGGVGLKINDSLAVEGKFGYSFFSEKGFFIGVSIVYTINEYKCSGSYNELNKLCSNILTRISKKTEVLAEAAEAAEAEV